jgi:glycine/D-amino acid oxidase-like deaminating enzyme
MGRERAERCYRRCRDAIGGLERRVRRVRADCGFERRPSLLLASREAHVAGLRKEFEARRAAGIAVEWWPARELAARSSLKNPAAIWSRDGAQVDAYALAHALLADARRRGARVHARTKVTRIRHGARGVELRTSTGGGVRARQLVIATGYEAQETLRKKITVLHSTYALASEPVGALTGWPAGGCIIWETARPYFYLRTTAENRVLMGGGDEPFRDPEARDRLLGAKTAALVRRCRRMFPAIRLEVACAWAGTFAETGDGLPFIGRHPERPNVWLALGYGGNGVTFGAIAAEVIRDGILGRRNPDAALFGFAREVGRDAR